MRVEKAKSVCARSRVSIQPGWDRADGDGPSSRTGEDGYNDRATSLLFSRGLLAFGTEFLALLAVKPLGVRLLGTFQRGGGVNHRCLRFLLLRPVRRFGRTLSPSAAGTQTRSRPRGKISSSWEHLGLERGARSRCDAEPRMNEAIPRCFRGAIFLCDGGWPLSEVFATLGWGTSDQPRPPQTSHAPKETKDDN